MKYFSALSFLLVAFMTAKTEPCEACDPAEPGLDRVPFKGVPTRGIVPFFIYNIESDHPRYPFEIRSVIVTDPAGDVVPGTFEQTIPSRLVWRSVTPLAPTTTYNAEIDSSSQGKLNIEFTTAKDDTLPTRPNTFNVEIYPDFFAVKQACCYSSSNDCPSPICFPLKWGEAWRIKVAVDLDGAPGRYFLLSGARRADSHHAPGGADLSQQFPVGDDRYCINYEFLGLLDQKVETFTSCIDVGNFPEAPVIDLDDSQCSGPLVDADTLEEIDTGDTGEKMSKGCSVSNADGNGFIPPVSFAFALFLISGFWRRRSDKSAPN